MYKTGMYCQATYMDVVPFNSDTGRMVTIECGGKLVPLTLSNKVLVYETKRPTKLLNLYVCEKCGNVTVKT